MARNPRQKQKLLFLQKILLEKTDENHGLTVNEIIQELSMYGITAERKSIYDDLHTLELFGLDICSEKTKTVKYFVVSRDFQISELKLLVDAVQSSKFITKQKSMELIQKIETLASNNEAQLLQRQVYVANRVKTENETIYYTVNDLHEAINKDVQVSFYYNQWALNLGSVNKIKLQRRRDGQRYVVSPWALCWDDENYYLIAYDNSVKEIRHYRVDKMEQITISDQKRQGQEIFEKFNIADYTKSTFGMFAGDECEIELSVHSDLIGVIADRFGNKVFVTNDPQRDNHFIVKTNVNISEQFFGWLFGLGDKIILLSPGFAVDKFKNHAKNINRIYEEV